jgi:hypothetical protein
LRDFVKKTPLRGEHFFESWTGLSPLESSLVSLAEMIMLGRYPLNCWGGIYPRPLMNARSLFVVGAGFIPARGEGRVFAGVAKNLRRKGIKDRLRKIFGLHGSPQIMVHREREQVNCSPTLKKKTLLSHRRYACDFS